MTAAVLCTGTEITRGEIVNTNAQWLAGKLTELGYEVVEIVEVGDDRNRLVKALVDLGARHEVLLCTGGLGPTTDDLTTECASLATGMPMVRDATTVSVMQERFARLGRTMVAGNLKQADFPTGSRVLSNAVGTAPGFELRVGMARAFFFPGVPAEMKRIFADHVEASLRELAPSRHFQIRLRTFGQPESTVGQQLAGVEEAHPGVTIGYRATFPQIDVKVLAAGADRADAQAKAEAAAAEVRKRLGAFVFAEGEDTMVSAVAKLLRARNLTLAIAESCTGGLVAHMITSEPASDYFSTAVVTYSNEAKSALIGVDPTLLDEHGAVSEPVAIAMARGVANAAGADVGISTTGIAGPTGGSEAKPVGTVHWAVAHPGGVEARMRVFAGDRARIQRMAAFAVLDTLRRVLAGL